MDTKFFEMPLNKVKMSARFVLYLHFFNKWVLWVFISSLILIYYNNFTPRIIFSDFWFNLWKTSENIIYSLIAACVFYIFLEVLPKVKAQIEFFTCTFILQEKLVDYLKFLNKILDSVPENVNKIEEVIYNSNIEIPQALGLFSESNAIDIILRINEKTKLEIKVFKVLYRGFPKSRYKSAIDRTMRMLILDKIPSEGEIAKIRAKIKLHLLHLSFIEAIILENVNVKKAM